MGFLDRVVAAAPTKDFSASSIGQSGLWSMPPHWARDLGTFMSGYTAEREILAEDFGQYVDKAYKRNGIVFACVLARMLPFSEARFQLQELLDGRPGRLFDDPSLRLLDTPWPNATTGDLLARMEQKASIAGNFYLTPVGDGPRSRLRELRPDWVTVVSGVRTPAGEFDIDGTAWLLDAEVLGYIYHPKPGGSRKYSPQWLSPERVVHYAPIPDPEAQWRGMSWLTPVLREVQADSQAMEHKLRFFQRGAALNVVVKYDKEISPTDYEKYVALFEEQHHGPQNAYKTLHLGGGADATVMSNDLKQIDFKAVQGAGETRIAAAAGVGAIIARFSEGLAGSSLNQGNYSAAKRQFADMTLRPLWRNAAGSLQKLVKIPAGRPARLWTDTRDVEFLKEDRKDAAEILSTSANTIRSLVDAGYDPDAVIDAVDAGDLSRLVGRHSGLFSVQLQPAGARPGDGGGQQA